MKKILSNRSTVSHDRIARLNLRLFFSVVMLISNVATGQSTTVSLRQQRAAVIADENAAQTARILGLTDTIERLRALQTSQTSCGTTPSLDSIALRQEILEAIISGSLDVDSVLAEIDSEKSRLAELRTKLAARRDRSLGFLNFANLITGTGLGIITNALQFNDSTAILGDKIGVASGIGSSALSLLAGRRQHGPENLVSKVPNMLAPLFGRSGELNANYPPTVLAYLEVAPAGEYGSNSSRREQLTAEWTRSGFIGNANSPKTQRQVTKLTAGPSSLVKLSIDDISNRIAMLNDVAGRVSLMKRDLASLMRSLRSPVVEREPTCIAQ